MSSFEGRKEAVLKDFYALLNDKSPKGSVDRQILNCIDLLNRHPDYYTTSSCSGRVAVFCDPSSTKAKDGFWLYVSHDPLDSADDSIKLQSLLQGMNDKITQKYPTDRFVYFKFEPLILHVECRTEQAAISLYAKVYQLGFRNSGISISVPNKRRQISGKNSRPNGDDRELDKSLDKKYVVAIRSALKLDAPIALLPKDALICQSIVDDDYVETLIRLANQKFTQNNAKILELESIFETL